MKKLLLIIIFFGFLAYLFDTSDDPSEINIEKKEENTQTKVDTRGQEYTKNHNQQTLYCVLEYKPPKNKPQRRDAPT